MAIWSYQLSRIQSGIVRRCKHHACIQTRWIDVLCTQAFAKVETMRADCGWSVSCIMFANRRMSDGRTHNVFDFTCKEIMSGRHSNGAKSGRRWRNAASAILILLLNPTQMIHRSLSVSCLYNTQSHISYRLHRQVECLGTRQSPL